MIEISSMIIVVRAVFHKNNKWYYPQVFLDECLYRLYAWKKREVSIFYLPLHWLPLHYW